jgi:hypothetical protein
MFLNVSGYCQTQFQRLALGYAKDELRTNSSSNNTNGYSLGLGYKQIVKGGLYGFGEVNYASYGKQTNTQTGAIGGRPASASITSSSNVFNVLVGIGYKF